MKDSIDRISKSTKRFIADYIISVGIPDNSKARALLFDMCLEYRFNYLVRKCLRSYTVFGKVFWMAKLERFLKDIEIINNEITKRMNENVEDK